MKSSKAHGWTAAARLWRKRRARFIVETVIGRVERALVLVICGFACSADDVPNTASDSTGTTIAMTAAGSGSESGAIDDSTGSSTTGADPFVWPDEVLVDSVDPFIGTGGVGFTVGTINPGATVPFGMVKPGPDTGIGPLQLSFINCTGYHFDQTHVWGFSHSRINGMGVPDYGALLIVPSVGMDPDKTAIAGARSQFDHAAESARPGYYAVDLLDVGVHAELTATMHVALHRYTWDAAVPDATVIVDLGYNPADGRSTASWIEIGDDTIRGMTTVDGGYSNRFGGVPTYFVARSSRPFAQRGVWDDDKVMAEGESAMTGAEIGGWVGFDLPQDDPSVTLAVAISYVSVEQAEQNLAAEVARIDFDTTRAAAEAQWEDELARVRVLGGSARERTIFYTALYHAFLAPTTFSEQGGWYRGFDDAIHQARDFSYYTDFSLWDTYRTLHPLLNLIQRDRHGDMMRSLVTMYEQGGDLPKWPLAFGYTGGMVGTSADIVLADAYLKEIAGFDPAKAYEGARLHAMQERPNDGREGITGYIERGWVAADEHGSSVSHTLEFAFADHALSQWAAAMNNADDAQMFAARAKNYAHHWSPDLGYLVGRRADGSFVTDDFDPAIWLDAYAEGTASQYTWMVAHDAEGLADLMGGPAAARDRLAQYMQMSAAYLEGPQYNPNAPVPYYWQSNEPSLHDAYLFSDLGDPAATQYWVDWIRARHYADTPAGLPGNDDAGTMSAWYVWSAIGLFPLPGSQRYYVTAPIFDRIELYLGDAAAPERRLTIIADDAGPDMIYVVSASFDGVPLDGPFITWNELRNGGTLHVTLADEPPPA